MGSPFRREVSAMVAQHEFLPVIQPLLTIHEQVCCKQRSSGDGSVVLAQQ
jgi:hypothetical protein